MSLVLSTTKIEVKTYPFEVLEGEVHFGEYAVPMEEFCLAAFYVMTNTDLWPDDPRRELQQKIASMEEVPGWRTGRVKFEPRSATV